MTPRREEATPIIDTIDQIVDLQGKADVLQNDLNKMTEANPIYAKAVSSWVERARSALAEEFPDEDPADIRTMAIGNLIAELQSEEEDPALLALATKLRDADRIERQISEKRQSITPVFSQDVA